MGGHCSLVFTEPSVTVKGDVAVSSGTTHSDLEDARKPNLGGQKEVGYPQVHLSPNWEKGSLALVNSNKPDTINQ